ncbi:MAG: hypothetical protein K8I30_11595 [Anaerolineae bacterium]|nr:hypothetical protein [Anaerolineae bacterium]
MAKWRVVFEMSWRGLVWGTLTGALIGFCLGLPVFIIGGLIGVIWGGGAGARAGLTTGLALSLVTLRWFHPLKVECAERYAQTIGWACPVIAGLSAFLWANWTYGAGSLVYLAALPALLAAASAILLSRWIMRWYVGRWL